METPDLEFTLFGGLKLDAAHLDAAQMENAELLAYLLCCNGEASKKAICRDLWNESPVAGFTDLKIELLYLQNCLRELSRNADGEAVSKEWLCEQQDRVLLRCITSDVGQFLDCLAKALEAVSWQGKLKSYEEAVQIYTNCVTSGGPLLEGGTWRWIARMRETLEEKCAVADAIVTGLRGRLESEQDPVPVPRIEKSPPQAPAPPCPAETLVKTVVFTDVEKSTVLWERYGDRFKAVWKAHDQLLRELAATWRIELVNRWGDSYYFAFDQPETAIEFCVEAQRVVLREDWQAYHPEIPQLRNRIGIHTGQVDSVSLPNSDAPDYINWTVNQAARITHRAMGRQIMISGTTYDLVKVKRFVIPYDDVQFHSLGPHKLKGIESGVDIWQVRHDDVPPASALVFAGRTPGQDGEELRTRAEAEELAQKILTKWLMRLAVTAWLPGSSFASLAVNVLMVREVANTFGIYDLDDEDITYHLKRFVASVGMEMAIQELWGLIPGPGWVIKTALMTGKAKMLGKLLVKYYRARSPLPD